MNVQHKAKVEFVMFIIYAVAVLLSVGIGARCAINKAHAFYFPKSTAKL